MATDHPLDVAPSIEVRRSHKNVSVVRLYGEHDLSSADHVQDAIETELAFCGSVVLDLSQTQYIDSHIVRILFHTAAEANNGRNRFALCVATKPIVERVLQITQATSEIPTYQSENAAIAALSES
jgi:anti-anti-sigma factor